MRNIVTTLSVIICLTFSTAAMGQEETATSIADESLKDIATVAGIGAGGAILGLSTLSFVEEPGDHLKNIVVGGAIGIIIGVGVVAWSQASKSKGVYDENVLLDKDFSTQNRKQWFVSQRSVKPFKNQFFNYSFKF